MWLGLFIASLSVNIIAVFYIRWLLRALKDVGQDLEDLASLIEMYGTHVGSVHELEMFYGDETLKSLMVHGRELVKKIENIDFILNSEKEEEVDDDTAEEEEKE